VTKQLVPEVVPRPEPPPESGLYLRRAVDAVLAELTSGSTVDALGRLVDTLRTGLAWTAATGQTCQVALAASAVRHAMRRLDEADTEQATHALLAARDGLRQPDTHG
jgi:hypothetical protein